MKLSPSTNGAFIEAGKPPKSKAERPQGAAERREGGRQWMGQKGRAKGWFTWHSKSCVPGIVCARPLNYKCLLAVSLSPPLLPSPRPLTHSLSPSLSLLLSPLFVLLSFFLFQLNEKECVWQGLAANSTWPHMRPHKNWKKKTKNRIW